MNEKTNLSPVTVDPALLIDIRGVYDRGWHASRRSEELAHLDSGRAAACASLLCLLPIISSVYLDEFYANALFAWDSGFHKTVKPRPPKPDGFREDLEYFRGILPILVGATHCTSLVAEADDVIATAAIRLSAAGIRSCVVSGDKDLTQLASKLVTYYCLNRKSILSIRSIMDRWDLKHPSQMAVRLAVVGDAADGINGVDKWADGAWSKKIMKTAPSNADLQQLIEHVASVIPPVQMENFYESLEATLLNDSVPNVPDPSPIKPVSIDFLDDEGLESIRSSYARFVGDFNGGANSTNYGDVASPADVET